MSQADLALAVRASLEDGGWIDESTPAEDSREMIDEAIGLIRQAAVSFPAGTVVGTRLGETFERGRADAPY